MNMNEDKFKDRMVSAAGWEGKMKPVYVGGMFFADNPDKQDGWGVQISRRKDSWALWVYGHGFVCCGSNMCYPVTATPITMTKDVAKRLCRTGIANWGEIFFVDNKDYYAKLIEKAVKKMGYIQLSNPVVTQHWFHKKRQITIDNIDYVEGVRIGVFHDNVTNKTECLGLYRNMTIVEIGRELVKTFPKVEKM